jgi:hypothetical protein
MFRAFVLSFLALTAPPALAQEASEVGEIAGSDIIFPGENADLSEFVWIKRPLVVFADSPADPRYVQQMEFITDRLDALAERDVIVLTDTDPGSDSALRRKLHPRGFMLVLIGKDGTIYLRKPLPWDVREISRIIDKLPMRQKELRDRLGDS